MEEQERRREGIRLNSILSTFLPFASFASLLETFFHFFSSFLVARVIRLPYKRPCASLFKSGLMARSNTPAPMEVQIRRLKRERSG